MRSERRSFLASLLSAASSVLLAGGMLLAPLRAKARPAEVQPKYGVPAKKPKKKDRKNKDEKKPPDVAPEYGVRRPQPKEPPKVAPEYGVRVPDKKLAN